MTPRRIRGSTIVVVGATSGVGRATALSLAAVGANLVVVARTADHVKAVACECGQLGAAILGIAADITDPNDVDRIVCTTVERFGHIDTWINAPGRASVPSRTYDNAPADSVNGLYKIELIRRHGPWRNADHLELETLAYVEWWNHRRLHGELGDVPPAEHEPLVLKARPSHSRYA